MARLVRDGWLAMRGRALAANWLPIAQMSAGAGLAWFLARDKGYKGQMWGKRGKGTRIND